MMVEIFPVELRRRVFGVHLCLTGKISGKAIAVATPNGFSSSDVWIFIIVPFSNATFSQGIFQSVHLNHYINCENVFMLSSKWSSRRWCGKSIWRPLWAFHILYTIKERVSYISMTACSRATELDDGFVTCRVFRRCHRLRGKFHMIIFVFCFSDGARRDVTLSMMLACFEVAQVVST